MANNDRVKYWVELSDYDLETARAMLNTGRFLYVGFMCHQSIEKILKACVISLQDSSPPFSHSLSLLAKKAGIWELFSENQQNFIDQLEPLNIEARYPSDKERLLRSLSREKCETILKNSEALVGWIKEKL